MTYLVLNLIFVILFTLIFFTLKVGGYTYKKASEEAENTLNNLSMFFVGLFIFGLLFITFYFS